MRQVLSAFRSMLPLLPRGARRFLWVYVVISSALAVLDIAALMLLAVALTGMVQGQPLQLPVIGALEPESTIWVLVVVCSLIVVKSLLAAGLQWVATRRFASYELRIGDQLFDATSRRPGPSASAATRPSSCGSRTSGSPRSSAASSSR